MSGYYLSIKVSPTKYEAFKVPIEVYAYVRQLENYILFPKDSKLLTLYPDRFNQVEDNGSREI